MFFFLAGRTYAMDCYLKLLVRLCHIYDTVGGVKKAKDGASPEQILAEKRLQDLQRGLVKDLSEVSALNHRVVCSRAPFQEKKGLKLGVSVHVVRLGVAAFFSFTSLLLGFSF